MADAEGRPYEALRTLAEAQAADDGVVVMEGDDGGQIYLTCPARLITCDELALEQLLNDLDSFGWNDPELARVFYERTPVGAGIGGGMGGGVVVEGLWLHEELRKLELEEPVRAVLEGRRPRIREP